MYGYLFCFLYLTTMICFTTSHENGNLFKRPVQRRNDADFASSFHEDEDVFPTERREIGRNHHNGHSRDQNRNVDPVRHTHTSTKVDVSQTSEEQSRMIYPTDMKNITAKAARNVLNSRNCSFGFCDEVDDYPSERVQKIIGRSTELKQFFTKDITAYPPVVISRFGEVADSLCSTTSHTRFPKSARNVENIEQLLVNVDNFKQGIVYETCTSNGGPCKYGENFPNNIEHSCVQKYTVRKLMVLGKESDSPIFDDFKIPSCCVCTVTKHTSP